MKQEDIQINIDANTQGARDALKELNQLVKDVGEMELKIKNTSNLSQKDFDKYMSQNIKFNQILGETKSALNAERRISMRGMSMDNPRREEMLTKFREGQARLNLEQERRRENLREHLNMERASRGAAYTRNVDNTLRHTNRPSSSQSELNSSQLRYSRIRSELFKADNTMNTTLANGYMTYQQGQFLDKSTRNFLKDYQGLTDKEADELLEKGPQALRGHSWEPATDSERRRAETRMEEANRRTNLIESQQRDAVKDFEKGNITQEEFDTLMQSYTEELKIQQSIHKKNLDIVNLLDESYEMIAKRVEEYNAKAATGDEPTRLEDRNSPEGRFQSRANVIATAIIGAIGYTMKSAFSEGRSIAERQRGPSMSIGTRTGNYDFRGIRRDNMRLGTEIGFKGDEMLAFADNIISNLGYTNPDELRDLTYHRAVSQRTMGVSEEGLDEFFGTTMRTGAVSTLDQAKAVQDGFIGAIKMSGMEGREEEQIKALSTIHQQLADGRNLDNSDIENQMAMAQVLSGTGLRSLQGDQLAQMMTSLDESIQNTSLFSDEAYMLGLIGNPQYAGDEGMWEALKQIEEGGTPENVRTMVENAQRIYGEHRGKSYVHQQHGLSTDNVDELFRLVNEGQLDDEQLRKRFQEMQERGGDVAEERYEGFMDSSDQTTLEREAQGELTKSLAADNALTSAVESILSEVSKIANMNSATAIGGVVVQGLTAGLAASAGSFLMPIVGDALTKVFNLPSGMLSAKGFATAAKGAGLGAKATGLGAKATGLGASALGAVGGKAGALGGAGLIGTGALGLYNVATAEKGDRLATTAEEGGRFAGAFGGLKAGAALGTAIGGPIGTAIGGGIGLIGGGILGKKGGEFFNDVFGIGKKSTETKNRVHASDGGETNIPDHDIDWEEKDKQRTQQSGISGDQTQEEQSITNTQLEIEKQKEENLTTHSEQLSVWDTLLSRIGDLLNQARAQNGIIGLMTGVEGLFGGASSGGSGVGGELGYTAAGQRWTSSNLTQHDLGKTIDTLTSGQLNEWINSKAKPGSAMYNQGEAFMKAGRESGLDPRYLVAHAAHETGWGTSNIVKKKGNFYGIGAFDASPMASAYQYDTNEAGIVEGAKWIAKNYYNKGQTNLRDMRYDPSGRGHNYATDPQWHTKIASTMKGADRYTSPSTGDVNINTTVNVDGGRDANDTARQVANAVNKSVNSTINNRFTREYRPI